MHLMKIHLLFNDYFQSKSSHHKLLNTLRVIKQKVKMLSINFYKDIVLK